jgi:hypothetical protein
MARLFTVLIGCDYQGSGRPEVPPLRGAENDARVMAALLAGHPIADGELAHLALLTREEATTANIRRALRQARRAQTRDDTLLVYFAGHGSRAAGGLTLYTWDGEYPAATLIADFGKRPKTTNIILDCCHAGAVGPALDDPMLMLKWTRGRLYFLCGAAADQTAGEARGHGLFTRTLVDTLAAPRTPPLLGLPIDLDQWCNALPADLRQNLHDMQTPADVLPDPARGGARPADAAPSAPTPGQTWGIEQ